MKILLTGATGLLGGALLQRLASAGHEVVCAGRRPPDWLPLGASFVAADLASDSASDWLPRLDGCDAAVNTIGIFKAEAPDAFERLHVSGPRALFDACVASGVRRVVHVSALGADAQAATEYHRSKRRGDQALLALPLDATVVQPSLIFSGAGKSSQALLALATLPALLLPNGGGQWIQPLHIDDAAQALQAVLEARPGSRSLGGGRVALVGPRPVTWRAYLEALRWQLGLHSAPAVTVPAPAMKLAARIGDRLKEAVFDSAAWSMLERGNTAPPVNTQRLLGRPPRDVTQFIGRSESVALRQQALMFWTIPILKWSLFVVWIVTGLVSLGAYPAAASYELLARAGVPGSLQPIALYGAALLDLVLGILTVLPLRSRLRRVVWLTQALLVAGYTAIITLRLPEFWVHPYGPLLKNVPILAILYLLWVLDAPSRPRARSSSASPP